MNLQEIHEPTGILNTKSLVYILETTEKPVSANRRYKILAEQRDSKKRPYVYAWKKLRNGQSPLRGFCKVEIWSSFDQDVDAPIKFVLDTMKGVLIEDDDQIVKIEASRIKIKKQKIKIKITYLGNVHDIMIARLKVEKYAS